MDTLPFAPLPRETSEKSSEFRRIDREGFIDEQAVAQVIARGAYERTRVMPAGVSLSACCDDYAGWMLPVKTPPKMTTSSPQRLPLPPTLRKGAEPGIGPASQDGHRWWLFGMAGAVTCGIIAFTLPKLAPRHGLAGREIAPAADGGKAPAASVEKPVSAPSLTSVRPGER